MAENTATPTKPGYKTTEFWLSLLAMVIGALLASGMIGAGGMAATIVGGVASILGYLGYAVPRPKVKIEAQKTETAKALASLNTPKLGPGIPVTTDITPNP